MFFPHCLTENDEGVDRLAGFDFQTPLRGETILRRGCRVRQIRKLQSARAAGVSVWAEKMQSVRIMTDGG